MDRFRVAVVALMSLFAWLVPSAAHADVPPDYGLQWATVGSPGNEAAPVGLNGRASGKVDYEYRITKTKVTNGQWVDFLNVYAKYYSGLPNATGLTGGYARYNAGEPYTVSAYFRNWATTPSFQMAARYCNWLHNDKRDDRAAFESGAYDLSTFTTNPDGSRNDQIAHSAGAKFWIPSLDEWIKAAYFDPNRYGNNIAGYWLYPYQSDLPPIPGEPGVGTTNAGMVTTNWGELGLYYNATGPWGLYDVSGGGREATETVMTEFAGIEFDRSRCLVGSSFATDLYATLDNRDIQGFLYANSLEAGGFYAFRVASIVPSPSTAVSLLLTVAFTKRKRSAGVPITSVCHDHDRL